MQRADLKARDFRIDLASKLNKQQLQSVTMPLSQQAGYYCDVCDCVLKDSMAYLDHINGKWHNRALGMSMRVEKSSADQVRKRLEEAKRKKRGEAPSAEDEDGYVPDGMSKAELAKQSGGNEGEDDEERKEEEEEEEEAVVDPEFEAMMGFGGFGSSKK